MARFTLLLVLLTACTGMGSTATTASVSRTAAPPAVPARSSALAVVTGITGIKWWVALAGTDGAIIAEAPVEQPIVQPNAAAPWTSASLAHLYYLNNRTEVRAFDPNGTTRAVTQIPAGGSDQAVFAVSPDDKRIAVSILNYAAPWECVGACPRFIAMRMYVEDLLGGGHHVEIFNSTKVVEFPIGWTGGRLVVAVSTVACCTQALVNPYNASSYHVVDPETGKRLASVCENGAGPLGPPEPMGAMCWQSSGAPTFQRWDGSAFSTPVAVPSPYPYLIAMSPDGNQVAVGGSDHIRIEGGAPHDVLTEAGYVFGWLDATHIVFQRPDVRTLSVFDLHRHVSADWTLALTYRGSLPPAIS